MSQKKNEGILFPTEIRVVGSYTDRLLIISIAKLGGHLDTAIMYTLCPLGMFWGSHLRFSPKSDMNQCLHN